jgi:putative lipoic acid-binding regulatory protein
MAQGLEKPFFISYSVLEPLSGEDRFFMDFTKFKALLDDQMSWPDYYAFKFVIKTDEKHRLLELFSAENHQIKENPSRTGKYTSVTCRKLVQCSDDVVAVYREVSTIEGIITL